MNKLVVDALLKELALFAALALVCCAVAYGAGYYTGRYTQQKECINMFAESMAIKSCKAL